MVSATANSTTISVRNDQRPRVFSSSASSSGSGASSSAASSASGLSLDDIRRWSSSPGAGPPAPSATSEPSDPASTSPARCSSFIITIQPNGQQAGPAGPRTGLAGLPGLPTAAAAGQIANAAWPATRTRCVEQPTWQPALRQPVGHDAGQPTCSARAAERAQVRRSAQAELAQGRRARPDPPSDSA